jgi:hypothetical protein
MTEKVRWRKRRAKRNLDRNSKTTTRNGYFYTSFLEDEMFYTRKVRDETEFDVSLVSSIHLHSCIFCYSNLTNDCFDLVIEKTNDIIPVFDNIVLAGSGKLIFDVDLNLDAGDVINFCFDYSDDDVVGIGTKQASVIFKIKEIPQ